MKTLIVATLIVMTTALFAADDDGFVPLFNGKDLSGWVNANCAPDTWSVKDGMIHCTGIPTGAMRTERQYENFILEVDWHFLVSGGNSGVFIWGTPISAPGVPFLRGIEVQVLDNGYDAKGKDEWYTTHGDIFPIHGATMKATGRTSKNKQRSFPSEDRSKSSPEWNHYRVECNNGTIRLSVNGKEVTVGEECNYRKGYLALESEGALVEFKNIRIKELPSTNTPPELTAPVDVGFRQIYSPKLDFFQEPEVKGRWEGRDWNLVLQKSTDEKRADLWTKQEWGDAEFIVDVKPIVPTPPGSAPAGIRLRQKDGKGPVVSFVDAPVGKFSRYRINVKGGLITVFMNEKEVQKLEFSKDAPAKGPLGFIDAGVNIEFGGIFARDFN